MLKLVSIVFVGLLVSFLAVSGAFSLLRQADDFAVAAGIALLFVLGLSWLAAGRVIVRRLVMVFVVAIAATGCTYIPPGYAGMVVNSYGSQRGVADYTVTTGRVNYNPWSEDIISFPTFVQTGEWSQHVNPQTAIFCNDKDGLPVGFNLSFGYHIDQPKIPAFYVKYRSEDLGAFSKGYLRNEAQGALSTECPKYSAEQLFGAAKDAVLTSVRTTVNTRMEPEGIVLDQFSLIGQLILPQQISQSIERKVQSTQRAQEVENQLREATAQAAKRVADAKGEAESAIEKARGQAEANRMLTASLSQQLLEWRRLTIQEAATNKWNGGLPTTLLGDSIPFVQIPK